MNQMSQDYFKRISVPENKAQIAHDLVKLRSEILCRGVGSDQIFCLGARKIQENKILCELPSHESLPSPVPKEVLASAQIENERYFLKTTLVHSHAHFYLINFSEPFYHLQRRESFRVAIPQNIQFEVRISDKLANAIDFSAGGLRCSIDGNHPTYEMNQKIDLKLKILGRTPMTLEAIIKHLKTDSLNPQRKILGIEYANLSNTVESLLFAATMDLHRIHAASSET